MKKGELSQLKKKLMEYYSRGYFQITLENLTPF